VVQIPYVTEIILYITETSSMLRQPT